MEHLSQTALEKCDGDWNLRSRLRSGRKGGGARGRRLRKGESLLGRDSCGRAFWGIKGLAMEGSGDWPDFNMVEVAQALETFGDEH